MLSYTVKAIPPKQFTVGVLSWEKGQATLSGRAPALCVRALCPGHVLLLSFSCSCPLLLSSSCPPLVLLLSFSCPPLVPFAPLVLLWFSSCPSLVFLWPSLCPSLVFLLASCYPPLVLPCVLLSSSGHAGFTSIVAKVLTPNRLERRTTLMLLDLLGFLYCQDLIEILNLRKS